MRYPICVLSILLFLGITAGVADAGESMAVRTMAGILMKLQHFPTDTEKQTLKQLADDKATTTDERAVAKALMNVQHTVAGTDKPNLEAIVSNAKASSSVRMLAGIILSLHHMPSDSDKERLRTLN